MNAELRQRAAQELLRRDEAIRSMWDFIPYMRPSAFSDFAHDPAPHHDAIIQALHGLERGDYDRLMILAPPGSAKSTYCSVQFPLWYLARNPQANVLCASNTEHLAESFNRRRRSGAMTEEWQLLSGTSLDPSAQGLGRWHLRSGGSCTAAGVGSSIVGLRSHLNILDDPIQSLEQSMSATQLEKIWDWMITDFRSRLVPNGKELIITTRWARRDPAGRILDLIASGVETGWHVLRLPMLCDSENDPMERAIGDPLWPEWFTERMVQEAKRDPLRWSALYQQRPLDESGAWVPMENVHLNDKTPSALNHIIAVDLALSVGRGDYTSIVTTGLDEDRHIHIVDIQRRRIPPNETADLLFELCHRFSPSAVLIDDDPAAKVFTRLLYELARERRQSIPLMPLPLRGRDKETRASAIRGWFLQDRVHIKRALWNDDLIREINEFPTGDHDDQIDALGLVGRYLVSAWSPSTPERVITDPYEGWLVRPDQPDVMQCSLDELFEAKPQRSLRI